MYGCMEGGWVGGWGGWVGGWVDGLVGGTGSTVAKGRRQRRARTGCRCPGREQARPALEPDLSRFERPVPEPVTETVATMTLDSVDAHCAGTIQQGTVGELGGWERPGGAGERM